MEAQNRIAPVATVSDQAVIEAPVRLYGVVDVQEDTAIGKYSFLHTRTTLHSNSSIGRYCSIGKMCEIGLNGLPLDWLSSSSFQYDRKNFPDVGKVISQIDLDSPDAGSSRTTVGNDVWMGTSSTIKRGVTVGHGAVIGARAVVTQDVPDYAIVVGAPARVLKYRFEKITIERLLASRWWERSITELANIRFDNIDIALDQLEGRSAYTAEMKLKLKNKAEEIFG